MAKRRQDSVIVDPKEQRDFYEGRWTKTDRSSRSLKNLLVKKERFFLRHLRRKHGTALDMGCAGGWAFFAQLGKVVGLDLSHTSLCNAKAVYSLPTQAAATSLPFANASFDYVLSLDFLGHVSLEDKDQVLSEIFRVLKTGGRTLHYIEAFSQDPFNTFARRYPELYERYLIAPEGHIGIETPAATYNRFRTQGFKPVREVAAYKGALYVERFIQYFDNEYKEKSWLIRLLVGLIRPISKVRPLVLAANLIITAIFEVFDLLLPESWAGGVLVSYIKPPD